ncbi:glutamate racemase [Acidovorax lacteus]|uniref:Glutamate racemase n=1 Tax=Acidovorax lacteus TaxID=1924988 RepID=A0ABP8LI50_9BURK
MPDPANAPGTAEALRSPAVRDPRAPIGVFDSGVGGLSVLQALQAELPDERFVYLADSGHAPYGERGDAYVSLRSHTIADFLVQARGVKALVVACNTATAAAIHEIRSVYPDLPLVGIEPALKPASRESRTGRVGVIATRGTVSSQKFQALLQSLQHQTQFAVQACDGLAHAIEREAAVSAVAGGDAESPAVEALCARYLGALGSFGEEPGEIDTLVLGCTHYVFARRILSRLAGPGVRLMDTGQPVARQTRRLLSSLDLLAPPSALHGESVQLLTTGCLDDLQNVARHWLGLSASSCQSIAV